MSSRVLEPCEGELLPGDIIVCLRTCVTTYQMSVNIVVHARTVYEQPYTDGLGRMGTSVGIVRMVFDAKTGEFDPYPSGLSDRWFACEKHRPHEGNAYW